MAKYPNHLDTQFRITFDLQLRQFMHPLFGFNVIKFDEKIGTPDNMSCHDFIEQKYGEEAVKLVLNLLKWKTYE